MQTLAFYAHHLLIFFTSSSLQRFNFFLYYYNCYNFSSAGNFEIRRQFETVTYDLSYLFLQWSLSKKNGEGNFNWFQNWHRRRDAGLKGNWK